jgi:hemolysin III
MATVAVHRGRRGVADKHDQAAEAEVYLTPAHSKDKHLDLLEQKAKQIFDPLRPALRGVPDIFAALAAIPAARLLYVHAHGSVSATAALVFGLAVFGMFSISATYHGRVWPIRTRLRLRRLDHSFVFVLIAGSYTPLCLTILPHGAGRVMLMVVWAIAAAGALKAWTWDQAPRWLNTTLYLCMGWMVFPLAPMVVRHGPQDCNLLLLSGGLLYSIGALIYANKWPDLFHASRGLFGHHELFHLMLIAAVCCHYRAVWLMVSHPPRMGTWAASAYSVV